MPSSKKLAKVKPPSSLTPKQHLFILEYLKDLNGTQAAIRAGYSPKSANSLAPLLLAKPSIQREILFRINQRDAKLIASADEVLETLTLVQRTKNKDLMKVDADGNVTGELDLQKIGELPASELTFGKVGTNKDGSSIVGVKKIKTASVLTAAELLGKHHKLFTDKVEHDLSDDLIRKLNEGRSRVGKPPVDIKGELVAPDSE